MINNENEITNVNFTGHDIAVCPINNIIYLAENNKYNNEEIAIYEEDAINLINSNTKVKLVFNNTKSVDVLIEALNEIKKAL